LPSDPSQVRGVTSAGTSSDSGNADGTPDDGRGRSRHHLLAAFVLASLAAGLVGVLLAVVLVVAMAVRAGVLGASDVFDVALTVLFGVGAGLGTLLLWVVRRSLSRVLWPDRTAEAGQDETGRDSRSGPAGSPRAQENGKASASLGAGMDEAGIERRVRTYYERIDADDYEGVFDLFAEDVTYHRPGRPPIEGLDALRSFYREERPLSGGEHVVEAVVVDGDQAAARGRFVGEQDGEAVAFGWADFHVFADGRIVERHTYTDRDAV
jgi:ketosteroid isomerase-like protein